MKRWWWSIGRYAVPETQPLVLIGALMLCGIVAGLLSPWPLKLIVDSVMAGKPLSDGLGFLYSLPGSASPTILLAWLAASTVGLFLVTRLIAILQRYVEVGAGSRMVYALASDLFHHLQRRSLLAHYQGQAGDLVKRVTSDTGCARELVIQVLIPSMRSVVTLLGMFAIMWQLDRRLAIFAVTLSVPLIFIIRLVAKPLSERRYREQELQGQIYSLAEQTLTAIPLVQSFGREQHENDRFRGLARRTIWANLRYELAGHQFKVSTAAVTAIGGACVMVFGGMAVLDGQLTVGSLLVLMTYFTALYSPLETLAYLSEGYASAKAGARRVLEILNEEPRPMGDAAGAMPLVRDLSRRGASIRFEDVVFGYAPNRPVLSGVSVEIAAGKMVALVGETGAGKSTLLSLLLRFFDPWQGAIYVDGADIRQVTLASLRSNIAYMPQQPFLLPLSVAENIAYGRPNATRSEIMAAASAAQADGFIRHLANGYDTVIGERGVTLSAGQRQRLSLARALLMNAPILILDEPTSALDPATEACVVEDVERLFPNCTVIVVAHRFSTIERATTAIVLDRGHIVEFGPPQELLSAGGRYHQLHQLQYGAQAVESAVNSCA
jgi:ATP-binding cassette subfamily B protein/subfamily B ATP-binding cassette protein MsbA